MKTVTWSRDSHGLFDYESRHVSKKNLKTPGAGKIVRDGNDIQLVAQIPAESENCKVLASLKHEDDKFTVNASDHEKLWLVVRSHKNDDGRKWFRLNENDIVKLGRVKYRVKSLVTDQNPGKPVNFLTDSNEDEENSNNETTSTEGMSSPSSNNHNKQEESGNGDVLCRFCYSDEENEDNPLISPCKCSGSLRLVHFQCLQYWLKKNATEKETKNAHSYFFKSMECELCKTNLPLTHKHQNKHYSILEIKTPKSNYLVLEALSNERHHTRGIHVITMDESAEVKLGRGHDSDVRISDISVSRLHAMIRYHKNACYIEDNDSKFGTLVQVKRPYPLKNDGSIAFQMGRTVISFGIKRGPSTYHQHQDQFQGVPISNSHLGNGKEEGNHLAEPDLNLNRIPVNFEFAAQMNYLNNNAVQVDPRYANAQTFYNHMAATGGIPDHSLGGVHYTTGNATSVPMSRVPQNHQHQHMQQQHVNFQGQQQQQHGVQTISGFNFFNPMQGNGTANIQPVVSRNGTNGVQLSDPNLNIERQSSEAYELALARQETGQEGGLRSSMIVTREVNRQEGEEIHPLNMSLDNNVDNDN